MPIIIFSAKLPLMNKFVKRYLIDALGGMALGLFASLLVGTIIRTLGQVLLKLGKNFFFTFLVDAGSFACDAHVVGAAMAISIAYALKAPALEGRVDLLLF